MKNLDVNTSSNVNIFIGENGAGKTNLLKATYAACEISKNNSGSNFFKEYFKSGSVKLTKDDKNRIVDIFLRSNDNDRECIAISPVFSTVRIVRNDTMEVPTKNLSDEATKNQADSYQIHFPENVSFSSVFIPCKIS